MWISGQGSSKYKCPGVDIWQVCLRNSKKASWAGVEQAMDEIKKAMKDQMVWIPLSEAGAVGGHGVEQGWGLTHFHRILLTAVFLMDNGEAGIPPARKSVQ